MASSWLCPELPAVPRQFVSCLAEQRLVRGVPASEREEANRTTGEHDLSPDEALASSALHPPPHGAVANMKGLGDCAQ